MGGRKRPSRAEREYLASYDASRFPHPSLAVDVALLSIAGGRLQALMVQRVEHPDRGAWSLPGGFVGMDESLDDAAARLLRDKGGVKGVYLEQLYAFGKPGRDPRTRVVTVAYFALVDSAKLDLPRNPVAPNRMVSLEVPWEGERGGAVYGVDPRGRRLGMAFDHDEILGLAVGRLRGKIGNAPIGFELLPREFTLLDLQSVHEAILGRPLNKDSFRRRMLDSGQLSATGRKQAGVGHRPAEFYRSRGARRPRGGH